MYVKVVFIAFFSELLSILRTLCNYRDFLQFMVDSDTPVLDSDGLPISTNYIVGIVAHAYNPSVVFKMFYLIAPRMQT